jgi:prepilin-type processing-associated H-X9-DG protein
MLSETTRNVYDGRPPAWGVQRHVGEGVDFGNASNYRRINEWYCCSWTTPAWGQITPQPGRLGEWGSPGSYHSGGCHVAMGDGTVRFLSENLDTNTRIRLGLIADGNPVGDF